LQLSRGFVECLGSSRVGAARGTTECSWRVSHSATTIQHRELEFERGGFEIYLPRVKIRRKKIEPLFPGYVFVRIEQRWHVINATIGIIRVLTTCDHPARLPDDVIDELRGRQDRRGFVKLPKPEPGHRVRILRGAFVDHVGIYEGAGSKDRERVLLALLGRMVPVEVHPNDLQFAS
jgi:transcriptional antiterminator RfaH